jgi:hypothetical protein
MQAWNVEGDQRAIIVKIIVDSLGIYLLIHDIFDRGSSDESITGARLCTVSGGYSSVVVERGI